jgi:hypothetical protein
MPRDPDIARLAKNVEEFLGQWVSTSTDPKVRLSADGFVRLQMLISVVSPAAELLDALSGDRPPLHGLHHIYDDEKATYLIAHAASGNVNADIVLSAIAAHHVHHQCAMPPGLRDYISRKLQAVWVTGEPWPTPRTRGRKRNGNAGRDFAITVAVASLVTRGLPIESARAQHSASSIVADALTNLGITLDDRSVVRIWKANREYAGWCDDHDFFAGMH